MVSDHEQTEHTYHHRGHGHRIHQRMHPDDYLQSCVVLSKNLDLVYVHLLLYVYFNIEW